MLGCKLGLWAVQSAKRPGQGKDGSLTDHFHWHRPRKAQPSQIVEPTTPDQPMQPPNPPRTNDTPPEPAKSPRKLSLGEALFGQRKSFSPESKRSAEVAKAQYRRAATADELPSMKATVKEAQPVDTLAPSKQQANLAEASPARQQLKQRYNEVRARSVARHHEGWTGEEAPAGVHSQHGETLPGCQAPALDRIACMRPCRFVGCILPPIEHCSDFC